MKIFASYTDEYEDEVIEQLKQDYRVQFYDDIMFCLERDLDNLETEYDVYFINANEVLFEIMLGGRMSFYDLDMQFADLMKNCDITPLLFYYKFDKILRDIQNMFDNLYWWNVENYKEVKDNYFGILCMIGKNKY